MKSDCGGAAAILGAFKAAVKQVRILRTLQWNILKVADESFNKYLKPTRIYAKICRALKRIFMRYFAWLKMLWVLCLQDLMTSICFILESKERLSGFFFSFIKKQGVIFICSYCNVIR